MHESSLLNHEFNYILLLVYKITLVPSVPKYDIKTQDLLYWEVCAIRQQGLRVLPKFLVLYFQIEFCVELSSLPWLTSG
jgi:hypothetical protein